MENLTGKCVVLGITGGIAAYKMANVASALKKAGADVHVIMTENATRFITPFTFETLTHKKCLVDTFDRHFTYDVHHISLAKAADVILTAPATADIIAKMAAGIADDMLTTVTLAAACPKLIAPSMNTAMLDNPITADNIEKLRHYGFTIIEPDAGRLACEDVGRGKLPEPSVLVDEICRVIACPHDMTGLRVTVPHTRVVPVISAKDMFDAVRSALPETDILIKSAAVADYRPTAVSEQKIKKKDGDLSLSLNKTDDILAWCGSHRRPDQYLCGFSMETENMLENSRRKLEKKGLDMIAANNVKTAGAGFAVDTNVLTLITPGGADSLPLMSKDEAAHRLLDKILEALPGMTAGK